MTSTVTTRPQWLNANNNVYTAWDLRRETEAPGAGCRHADSFKVVQRQAGANMSVDIGQAGVGLMEAWVRGSTRGGQGLYKVDNIDRAAPSSNGYVAQINDAVTANGAGSPRLDQVVLEVLDAQHTGASNVAQIRVVAGTATGGATLDNRSGAAALPASSILLADIIVASGAASIVTANIRDRRSFPIIGVGAPIFPLDQVTFIPHPGINVAPNGQVAGAGTYDNFQSAALMYLPRLITGATRIRWRYLQGSTANANGYNIGIADASGRMITSQNGTFTGAANSFNEVSLALAGATTFEPGAYWVFLGIAAATAASSVFTAGVSGAMATGATGSIGVQGRNQFLRSATGGGTPPTTLLGFTDMAGVTVATLTPTVPIISLSVG